MKRLILHIGNPKAGSTSLQRFLVDNRAGLEKAGVAVPVLHPDDGPRHSSLREALAGGDDGASAFGALAEALRAPGADVLVLTSEGIAAIDDLHRAPARLARFAEAAGAEIDVVAFVRPQPLFLNSSYTQHVKNLLTAERFEAFVARMAADRRFDYGRVYGPWAGVFGRRFHAVAFTAAELRDGLERRFFRQVGLEGRLDEVADLVPPPHSNRSPGPLAVEVMRRLAAAGGRQRIGPRLRTLRRWLEDDRRGSGWSVPSFAGLTPVLVRRLRDIFHERNEAFANLHWGRSWDEVFAADHERDFVSNEYDATTAGAETEARVAAVTAEALAVHAEPESFVRRFGRIIGRIGA